MNKLRVVSAGLKVGMLGLMFGVGAQALAMELDWSGQFRSELNVVHNYSLDNTGAGESFDPGRAAGNGYYTPSGGQRTAHFQTLFMKLRPKLVVNDNVYIKSEWWVGDPIYGVFGNGVPYSTDQRRWNSTFNRGAPITAQRFWGEFLSEFGTVQVGRAPLNWGLGVVWNSGDGMWDRYASTGDTIRLISKFGAFTFIPSFVSYSAGNTIGGACSIVGGVCVPAQGTSGVSEYTMAFRYENQDEDFDGGVNLVRRIAGIEQDRVSGLAGPENTAGAMHFNTWDIYGKKRLGKFTLSGEFPITSGNLNGPEYSTFAVFGNLDWKMSDSWESFVKVGHAPGQPNGDTTALTQFKAFYFHPNIHPAMIMFNYQLANFAGINTQNNPGVGAPSLASPYDNPIVNANFINVGAAAHVDKWGFKLGWTYAKALETASTGKYFYNTRLRQMVGPAVKDQENGLGWEADYTTSYQWDEAFQFSWDLGVYSPGGYYKFSNTAVDNATSMVYASSFRLGVSF